MTKRREPLTYHSALSAIAARIGWDTCGAICGVTGRAARYWGDPDCETEIRLLDAERLDRAYLAAGGDHAPFHRLFTLRCELEERDAKGDLARLAAATAKETGEAVAAMISCSVGASAADRRHARDEIKQAIDKLTDGLACLGEEK